MTSLHTDILIVGGGPAGATLARVLPDRYSILLVDKKTEQGVNSLPYGKPCGGLIAPDAQACLFHSGLTVPLHVLTGPQIFGVRAIDLESGHQRTFHRHYLNIQRNAFDRWLLQLAAARENVTIRTGLHLVSFEQQGQGVQAFLSDGTVVHAQVLIGADGAGSRTRMLVGQDVFRRQAQDAGSKYKVESGPGFWKTLCTPRRYLAMQAWYTLKNIPPEFGAFFHQQVTDYYSWSIPKKDALIVGTAIPWPNGIGLPPKERFQLLTSSLAGHGYALEKPFYEESCTLLCPSPVQAFPLGSGRVYLAGEAAGFISPSSAEGLSYAFRSAMSLAKALSDTGLGPEGPERYRRETFRLRSDLRGKCLKSAVIYHPSLRRMTLASGVGSFSATSLW